MNWCHIAAHHVVIFLLLGRPLKKQIKAPSIENGSWGNLVGIFFCWRVTGSDFWYNAVISSRQTWRHFTQKKTASWRVNMKRLPSPICSSDHKFLIYSTFVQKFQLTRIFISRDDSFHGSNCIMYLPLFADIFLLNKIQKNTCQFTISCNSD